MGNKVLMPGGIKTDVEIPFDGFFRFFATA